MRDSSLAKRPDDRGLNGEIMAEKASHSGDTKPGGVGPQVAKGVRNLIQTG